MTCEDVKRGMELPLDWHTPDKLREMWQHMSGCRTCNERYGWQFQLWWLMRDAMEEPPPGLADRIMLEVRAQKQPVVRRLPWWKRRRTLAAFAAALHARRGAGAADRRNGRAGAVGERHG